MADGRGLTQAGVGDIAPEWRQVAVGLTAPSAQKDFIKLAIARGVTAVAGTPVSQLSAPVVFAAVFPPGRGEGGAE